MWKKHTNRTKICACGMPTTQLYEKHRAGSHAAGDIHEPLFFCGMQRCRNIGLEFREARLQ
jgi:hypothetical protein